MDYFETALNYEMTATEAMEMDMSRRQMRREALENHFWERKYAGEALA